MRTILLRSPGSGFGWGWEADMNTWQTFGIRSTGGNLFKTKRNGELGNTAPLLSLAISENKSHRIMVTWDFNSSLHKSSAKPGATGGSHQVDNIS